MNAQLIQPPMMAFKEWHAVCEALQMGAQSILLRKGGIAEGRDGFAFSYPEFLLFPTFFHAQSAGLRSPVNEELPVSPESAYAEGVPLKAFCRVVARGVLTDWDEVLRLEPYHQWQNTTLRERFEYGGHQCLHLAVVRTFRLQAELRVPYEKAFGGCRSWVSMPLSRPVEGLPVIDSEAFDSLLEDITKSLHTSALKSF